MTNQQSAARSTSNRKQHQITRQLRTYMAAFPVNRCKRLKQQRGLAPQQQQSTPSIPLLFLPRVLLGKRTTHRCDTCTKNCLWFLTWIPCTTFAWRSLTTGTIFPLVFCVEKSFPIFWYTLPIHAICQTKSACKTGHQSLCDLTRTYIACTSTNYVDVCARTTTLEAMDVATRNAGVWLFLAQQS